MLFSNHIYLYICGYLRDDLYNIIVNLFIIPDMSIGMGYRNTPNHGSVDWITKLVYIITHCGGCIIGLFQIFDEDLYIWIYYIGYNGLKTYSFGH